MVHILRFSVVLFGKKHVKAKLFDCRGDKAAFREHITRLYNARIIK